MGTGSGKGEARPEWPNEGGGGNTSYLVGLAAFAAGSCFLVSASTVRLFSFLAWSAAIFSDNPTRRRPLNKAALCVAVSRTDHVPSRSR